MKTDGVVLRMEALPEERRQVEQAKSGDSQAFAQLHVDTVERVYRYIYFRVSDRQTAEDLTSQVFLKAWEKLDRYQPRSSFMAWLYAIARNTVIDHYRMRRPVISLDETAVLVAGDARPGAALELQFEIENVQAAMQQLTEDQREVLLLKFIAGFDTPQIARKLGKSQGAVRALQMRALQALARLLSKEDRPQVKE